MEVHEARSLELVPADPGGAQLLVGAHYLSIGQTGAERDRGTQVMVKPPSTASVWPVT